MHLNNFFEIDFAIKPNDKKSRRFDLSERINYIYKISIKMVLTVKILTKKNMRGRMQ